MMRMMPLHLLVNKKSDYDYDESVQGLMYVTSQKENLLVYKGLRASTFEFQNTLINTGRLATMKQW